MSTRATPLERPDLTFRGLDRCDQCGEPLEPKEQLWGLCERSLSGDAREPNRDRGTS